MVSASGQEILAFTLKAHAGLLNQLITPVDIIIPNTTTTFRVNAIWDTGATASVITDKVVNALGLIPTGMSNVQTANGATVQRTFIVDIGLPNQSKVRDVTVTAAPALSSSSDVLIGMDIIMLGDFAITNKSGFTWMSFRIPSCFHIDFVENPNFGIKQILKPGQPGSNVSFKKKKRR